MSSNKTKIIDLRREILALSIIVHCAHSPQTSLAARQSIMASSSIIHPFTIFIFLFSASASSMTTDNFIFNGFRDGAAANLTTTKGAQITPNGVLQLTNDTQKVIGQAFFSSPFNMLNNHTPTPATLSFSTTFVFEITTIGSGCGHGLTFAVSPTKSLPEAQWGQYLGLLSKFNNGNQSNHIFAVEFDTFPYGLFNDIDDNHVGVDLNSLISNVSHTAAYYTNGSKSEPIQLDSGSAIQAWVDFDGVGKILNVTISPVPIAKPHRPLISQKIDLAPILKEFMYVGFTSATGKVASSHYILGWSFTVNGLARPLDLSKLPSPPQVGGRTRGNKAFGVKIGVASSFSTLAIVVTLLLVLVYLRHRAKLAESLEEWELEYPHRYAYKDLYRATKGFRETELLGSGGFGQVFKGVMPKTGEEVAIKRISNSSKQGARQFVAEIASLGWLRHRNLVRLQGWCKRDQDLILVYEFMPNNSLDSFLFDHENCQLLNWDQRFKIVKDIASGLLYLHEEWEQLVIHRDIKASNVLLDGEMNGKLGDFGLAKLHEHGSNPQTTRVVGTIGYIAPELSRTGKASASTDVFAFGTLLLEVVCGRRPIELSVSPTEFILLDWVRQWWAQGKLQEVVDPRIRGACIKEEVEVVLKLGLLCSQSVPEARPTIRQVIHYLNMQEYPPDDSSLAFSVADSWDLASRSYPSSCVYSTSSLKDGRN